MGGPGRSPHELASEAAAALGLALVCLVKSLFRK